MKTVLILHLTELTDRPETLQDFEVDQLHLFESVRGTEFPDILSDDSFLQSEFLQENQLGDRLEEVFRCGRTFSKLQRLK